MTGPEPERLRARRAVEALRAGVPSSAAVDLLGTGHVALEESFHALLRDADAAASHDGQTAGLLLRGEFGTGKSHLLTTFEHLALAEGFCVSRVVISKETPLHDPAKLLASAAEAIRSPGEVDRGLDPVARHLADERSRAAVADLECRLSGSEGLNSRFAATLFVYVHGFRDQELADRVVRFWSGDKLGVADIRRAAKELGRPGAYPLEKVKARALALQAFTFLPLLVRAAGLRGWVLLLDEIELIGRYSRLQRARAYAELARWLGHLEGEARPGLVAVAAISADFESNVLRGEKADLDGLTPYMAARELEVADAARVGMGLIREATRIPSPDDAALQRTYDTLRALHGQAYGWEPPNVSWPEALGTASMRTFVRAWINAWDVHRLYPDFVEGDRPYEMHELRPDYREDPDLGRADDDAE